MSCFYCMLTNIKVTADNIEFWKKNVKKVSLNVAYNKVINRFGATDISSYINIIENGFHNNNIDIIIKNYERIKNNDLNQIHKKEKETFQMKVKNSFHSVSDNIYIRMLDDDDMIEVSKLFINFFEIFDIFPENPEKITHNSIFGLFIDNKIEGYVVVNENRKFKTDFSPDEEINTYYIQEIFINPQHRNKKLGKVLFEYTIQRSSNVIISLMTISNNISMICIAECYGFIAQSISSGDDLHSLLMIYKK